MRKKWRLIFAWGDVRHPSGDFTIDADFFRGLLYAFRRLKDTHKYMPPITAEHPEIMAELSGESELRGANYGVIAGLKADEEGIWGGFILNELGARLDALGALQYLSPSFYKQWQDPHTGEMLGPVLREVSFVDVPHQKNISAEVGQIYGLSDAVSLSEAGFQQSITYEEKMMENEMMEDVAEVSTDVLSKEYFDSRLDEILALLQPANNADAEAEEPESADLSEQIKSLRKELEIERASNRVRSDLGALATDELVRSLAPMSLADGNGYKAVVAVLRGAKPAAQTPAGKVGAGEKPANLSEQKLVSLTEQAAKSGTGRGLALVRTLRSSGASQDQINAFLADADKINRIYAIHGAK